MDLLASLREEEPPIDYNHISVQPSPEEIERGLNFIKTHQSLEKSYYERLIKYTLSSKEKIERRVDSRRIFLFSEEEIHLFVNIIGEHETLHTEDLLFLEQLARSIDYEKFNSPLIFEYLYHLLVQIQN